jgi:hypothetical protein
VHLSQRLIVLLIATSPAILFADNPMTSGLVAAVTAAAIGIVALSIRSVDAQFLSRLLGPVAILAAIPVVWMFIQLLPMPFGRLSHPIWASAASALGMAQLGGMSIDPGTTLISMTRYLCSAGIAFITCAATVDRWRAERVLFALVSAASVTAVMLVVYNVGGFPILGASSDPEHAAVMAAISALGTIVAAAATIRALERYETRRSRRDVIHRSFWIGLAIWVGVWSISWFAISDRTADIFAAACGTGTLAIIGVIRRLGVARRASAALAGTALAVAIAVVATRPSDPGDMTLRFAATAPPSSLQMTQQMLTDVRWTGAGAGAFSSLAPIYRGINDPEAPTPPTTAAAVAIEMGRPALVLVVVMSIVSAALLAVGALRRGRDSFYPAASAGCIIVFTIEMFTNATALSTSVQIVVAAIAGLGLAQIKSRSRGQ